MEKEKLIQLVQQAQSGNLDAISVLFEGYKNTVYSIALRETKDRTLAEDIVQETFIEVIQTIGNLKNPEAISLWIKHIAYHQCTRYYKKKETKHELQAEELEDGLSVFDTLEERNASFIPDEALDQKEFRETILSMIDELPDVQSSALRMFYFDELPLKVIAKAQGVSVNTANTRLNRGRKAMKDSVESYEKKHGIRLHTIAFFPFFRWLLADTKQKIPAQAATNVAKNIAVKTGIRLSAKTGAATGSATATTGATTVTSISTVSNATVSTAAGVSVKAATGSIATKVIAGVLAASVTVGGVTVYKNTQVNVPLDTNSPATSQSIVQEIEPSEISRPSVAQDIGQEATITPTIVPTAPSDLAIEAYEDFLHNGYARQGFVIHYYAYLDIDQDGIPELIVADSDGSSTSWTMCEMYTYRSGHLQFCGNTDARYTPLYYVNKSHLLGISRMGAWYVSPEDAFGTVYYFSAVDSSQTYSEKLYNNGTREIITKEEFDWYNAFEIDQEGNIIPGGFVESAEPIILQRNLFKDANILEETLDFSKAWSSYGERDCGLNMVAIAFEPNGDCHYIIGRHMSGTFYGYNGYFRVEGSRIIFWVHTDLEDFEIQYDFDPADMTLTQTSERGFFPDSYVGEVLQLEEDQDNDAAHIAELAAIDWSHNR